MTAAVVAGAAAAFGYGVGVMSTTEKVPERYIYSKPKKAKKGGGGDAGAGEGDAKQGAALFKAKCATCHSCIEGGPTKQGPNLYGIMGAKAAVS